MPKTTTFHVRIPVALRKQVKAIVEHNGMDLASVVRLFFRHIAVRGTVPLPWLTVNGFSPEFEQSVLQQIRHPNIVATLKTKKDVRRFFDEL